MVDIYPKEKKTEEIRVLVTPSVRERMERIRGETGLPLAEQARRAISLFLDEAAKELPENDEALEPA